MKDGASANTTAYLVDAPAVTSSLISNVNLYIDGQYTTTSVVDSNGDAISGVTVYDRIFAANVRGANLHLPGKLGNGPTENRPTLTANTSGFEFFDTTLGKPTWWNGTSWTTWEGGATEIVSYDTVISSLSPLCGKYYRIDPAIGNLTITLPAMSAVTSLQGIYLSFTTSASSVVTFTSADNKTISYYDSYDLSTMNVEYEISCVYNGSKWVIASAIVSSNNQV